MNLKDIQKISVSTDKESLKSISEKLQSQDLISETSKERHRIRHPVDYREPANFARYGSAEKYYVDSITNIYSTYPYDGSKKEKQEWRNNASDVDLFILDSLYPKSAGYVVLGHDSYDLNNLSSVIGSDGKTYYKTTSPNYVLFHGGPNSDESFEKSNIIDVSTNRVSNLSFDGVNGTTVEFWFKRDLTDAQDDNFKCMSLLDIWNGKPSSDVNYSRLVVETSLHDTVTTSFILTYVSGANKAHRNISFQLNDTVVKQWNHYAFTFKNVNSDLKAVFFLNGEYVSEVSVAGAATSELKCEGLLNLTGTLGAYQTNIGNVSLSLNTGSVYGSFDEFRFWKKDRTEQQIRENMYSHVGGGVNTDEENSSLGVYFKFNEGKTNNISYDAICLDYSGRVSNGYIQNYSTGCRITNSAIEEYDSSVTEEKDPIVYKIHPLVEEILTIYQELGFQYDQENANSLINTIPSWILDEEEQNGSNEVKNLVQILASYLDFLHIQIEHLPKIRYTDYSEGEYSAYPIYSRFLNSYDFKVEDIFSDANFKELILSKDDDNNYEKNIDYVKNQIFRNIHNNLSYIYKSKGTIKSFRNLLRCFGIDEELIKINIYSDNAEYQFNQKTEETSLSKRFSNFYQEDKLDASLYSKKTINDNSNSGYIGYVDDNKFPYIPITLEAEIVFPKKHDKDSELFFPTNFLTSSLFGIHTAVSDQNDVSWEANDLFNFETFAIRDNFEENRVKFAVSSSAFSGFYMETSEYYDVYDNDRWVFALKLVNKGYELGDVFGQLNKDYTIELQGVRVNLDTIDKSFNLYGTIPSSSIINTIKCNKRVYLGANRQDNVGQVLHYTDIKAGSLRYWMNYLDSDTIIKHAFDASSYGIKNPFLNAYSNISGLRELEITNAETLILNWDFSKIDELGSQQTRVYDISNGELNNTSHGVYSQIFDKKHNGYSEHLSKSDYTIEYLTTSKNKLPETVSGLEMIQIKDADEVRTKKEVVSTVFNIAFEKSMYQTISEDMMKIMSSVLDMNNLIGHPINQNLGLYKELQHLKKNYFKDVNNTPSLEKYIQFYKWVDSSIVNMLQRLVPASAKNSTTLSNVIESHILERNKITYTKPYGYLGNYIEQDSIFNTNAHPMTSDHRQGMSEHRAVWSPPGKEWLKKRIQRTDPLVSSGNSSVDQNREILRKAIYHNNIAKVYNAYDESTNSTFNVNEDKTRIFSRVVDIVTNLELNQSINRYTAVKELYNKQIDFSVEFDPSLSGSNLKNLALNKEKIYSRLDNFEGYVSDNVLPFTTYKNLNNDNIYIANNHEDTYGQGGIIGLQGPFTEEHVGGNIHRHYEISSSDRLELYKTDALTYVSGVSSINPIFYRNTRTKRPVNIENVKNKIEKLYPGNYNQGYEIISVFGRYDQNIDLGYSGSYTLDNNETNNSLYNDFTLKNRKLSNTIIVTKFSTPGAETSNRGSLDSESEEYSAYNSINNRNLKVRKYLNKWWAATGSTSDVSTSFHKTPKNTTYIQLPDNGGLSQIYDNYFIQHQIPTLERGYSWISASVTGAITSSGFINSKQPNIDASEYNKFITSSYDSLVFVGQQTQPGSQYRLINVNTSSNVVSFTGNGGVDEKIYQKAYLHQLNGAYQYPSWKQIRNYENPIVRLQRSNNKISVQDKKTDYKLIWSKYFRYPFILSSNFTSYVEPVLQINHPISMKIEDLRTNYLLDIDCEHDNISASFSNPELQKRIYGDRQRSDDTKLYEYKKYKTLYNRVPDTFRLKLLEYKDRIFPRDENVTLNKIRSRPIYTETTGTVSNGRDRNVAIIRSFWRDSIQNRKRTTIVSGKNIATSSAGYIENPDDQEYVILQSLNLGDGMLLYDLGEGSAYIESNVYRFYPSQNISSIFCLDFSSLNPEIGESDITYNVNIRGELQPYTELDLAYNTRKQIGSNLSKYYWKYNLDNSYDTRRYIPKPQLFYINAGSRFAFSHGLDGISVFNVTTGSEYKMQSTSNGKKPWYDSYEEFFDDIRPLSYEYSYIPEYRFEEVADYYIRDRKGNFSAPYTSSYIKLYGTNEDFSNLNSLNSTNVLDTFLFDERERNTYTKKLSIKVKGIKKLLPYKGFYPSDRTVQLFREFCKSWTGLPDGAMNDPNTSLRLHPLAANQPYAVKGEVWAEDAPTPDHQMMSLIQPLFAPGILFNSLKSGLAVDWPAMIYSSRYRYPTSTSGYKNGYIELPPFYQNETLASSGKKKLNLVYNPSVGEIEEGYITSSYTGQTFPYMISTDYTYRFPFEALLEFDTIIPRNFFDKDRSLYYLNPTIYQDYNFLGSYPEGENDLRRYPYYFLGSVSGTINPLFRFRDEAYKLAMHNFLAEVPNFFLKNGSLNTFSSKRQSEGFYATSGTTYKMDVVLSKKINNNFYEYISKYGPRNHYGPPMNMHSTGAYATLCDSYPVMLATDFISNYSMLAHSPPYFYGDSVTTLEFTAKDTRNYSIREIINALKLKDNSEKIKNNIYRTLDDNESNTFSYAPEFNALGGKIDKNIITGSIGFRNKMSITSSINISAIAKEKLVQFDDSGNPINISDVPSDHMDTWIIQPKWECPILTTSTTWDYWTSYGTEPNAEDRLFLQIRETEQQLNVNWTAPSSSLNWSGFWDFPGFGFGGGGFRPFGYYNPKTSTNTNTYNWSPSLYEFTTTDALYFDLEGIFTPVRNYIIDSWTDTSPTTKYQKIGFIPDSRITTGSLIELCGFEPGSRELGSIADEKEISEAIVMIPYTQDYKNHLGIGPSARTILPLRGENNMFFDRASVDKLFPSYFYVDKQSVSSLIGLDISSRKTTTDQIKNKLQDPKLDQNNSIIKTMRAMLEYNMPPNLDWVSNKSIDPFVMYVFEFKHTLDKEDLIDIWQGLLPKAGKTAEIDEVTIEHQLGRHEFFHGKYLPDDVRWKIFKIKKKARTNYYELTADSKDDNRFKFKFVNGSTKPEYSYNWPYDFFSLVEMGNVEASLKFTDEAPINSRLVPRNKWWKVETRERMVKEYYERLTAIAKIMSERYNRERRLELYAAKKAEKARLARQAYIASTATYTKSLYE